MKLAASHIGWAQKNDGKALEILQRFGFVGLEIAPTRAGGAKPYDNPVQGAVYADEIKTKYNLHICSLQSIWFGQAGNMFGQEREFFIEYTKKAILYARAIGAGNLVFGCPKNRQFLAGTLKRDAIDFFKPLCDFAAENDTALGLEANPPIYGTNFMNTTAEALEMIDLVQSTGCKLNLDFGTIVLNHESILALQGHVKKISHVHISEPELAPIKPRQRHKELAALLQEENYKGYISIEMKEQPIEELEKVAGYISEVFG